MNKSVLLEFVSQISEEQLSWLSQRLSDRYENDLPEALNFLSNFKPIDSYLRESNTANQLFDCCDYLRDSFIKECKKKNYNKN